MRLQRKLFLAYQTRVFSIFTSADKSYLTYPFPTCGMDKQVSQRATIAHRSPMCQGQISFQKAYKLVMEARGPKSNSSELLCPSWLPATLMMIRSKLNELALRHHFPMTSLWEFLLDLKGSLLRSQWPDLGEIRTRPRFYACPRYLQV